MTRFGLGDNRVEEDSGISVGFSVEILGGASVGEVVATWVGSSLGMIISASVGVGVAQAVVMMAKEQVARVAETKPRLFLRYSS